MSVYIRPGSDTYSYDFRIDGLRYSGDTGTSDRAEAKSYEQMMKDNVVVKTTLCRSMLRRARRTPTFNPDRPVGHVYMIRSGYFVKIGYSADPMERMRMVAVATPDTCELVFCVRGDMKLEKRLHKEFSASHYRGEWFFLCGKLKHFLDEAAKPENEDTLLPKLQRRGSANSHIRTNQTGQTITATT